MPEHTMEVPVDLLGHGLYVTALDRPWTETPFLFQGFRIASDDELETLRSYCRRVVIDVDLSDGDALAAARQAAERPQPQPARAPEAAKPADDEAVEALGAGRFPDTARFRELVRAAHRGRTQARQVVDTVMRDIRLGRMIDGNAAREAVREMAGVVTASASAALWLTNLKDRDEYTSIHCVNVCILALAFGHHLGLPHDELRRLGVGALLHDVGKTLTPPEILNKPGALTAEEFEIIMRHPVDGHRIVAETGHVAREALEVIHLHHERRDGGGYPLGLAGDRIPRRVLITAIADSYDAMTTDRPNREAMAPDRVLQVLYNERSGSFGEDLVQEFIRSIGIFPVGSVVELDNGALGVVVASRADARLQPTVLLLRTPDGEPYDKRLLVNLAASAGPQDPVRGARRIRRAREPGEAGVDVAALVASEFGLTPAGDLPAAD